MASSQELVLAYPLEPVEVGDQFQEWPQHLTLMPWFTVENQTLLRSKLHGLAYRQAPISIEVGEDAMFGPEADVPVQLVKPNQALTSFHNQVLEAVRSQGRVFLNQFVEDNYRPHITEQRGKRFSRGQLFILGEFVLVAGSADEPPISRVKTVVAEFLLSSRSQADHETAT